MIVQTVCKECGAAGEIDVNPAALMGAKKKTMSAAAILQRQNAAKSRQLKKEKSNVE